MKALFSLFKTDNALSIARRLIDCGWEIIATNNLVKILEKKGIKVQDVADFLNIKETYPFPPTLHPKMELSLTTNKPDSIQLVFDTTYPLSESHTIFGET